MVTEVVKSILNGYESETPGVKANLARILMHGRLGGTGKLLILPVDQGFEHGPIKSFEVNPDAFDPHYHFSLAVEAGMSAYAAPLGMLQAGAASYAGQIPMILKLNSSNAINCATNCAPDQAITASVKDALHLGCSAVGFTLYPGSPRYLEMVEELREIVQQARAVGLVVVVWSYARGFVSPKDELALDVICYGAHMACLLGAHIVKVKLPSQDLALGSKVTSDVTGLKSRVAAVKRSCFAGKRLVVFSGGASKGSDKLYEEVRAIREGGGNGSIIGRNTFQRPRSEALKMLNKVLELYSA